MESPNRLRARLRARRAALPASERTKAAGAFCQRLVEQPWFADVRHLAAYLAVNGELDPGPLLAEAHRRGKAPWVPVVTDSTLRFAAWDPTVALEPNRFGIPEPAESDRRYREPWQLDLAVLPLVAFDRRGARLGMGGGFYDRAFSFILHPGSGSRPRLVGAAYAFQEVSGLDPKAWDVPLDAIATDKEWIVIEG